MRIGALHGCSLKHPFYNLRIRKTLFTHTVMAYDVLSEVVGNWKGTGCQAALSDLRTYAEIFVHQQGIKSLNMVGVGYEPACHTDQAFELQSLVISLQR